MKELILIKLGGSVVTDKRKPFFFRRRTVERLAGEIASVIKKNDAKFIIGNGAGSFAHVPAHKYQTKNGILGKNSLYGMAITADAARELNRLVVKILLKKKVPAISISPMSFLISDAQSLLKSYIDPIDKALEIGSIPVVYGDVVMDKKQGFTIFSTEKVFSALVAGFFKKYRIKIILVSDVDGVYDNMGKVIPLITPKNFNLVKKGIKGAGTTDVTGGMFGKVESMMKLAQKYCIEIMIVNGKQNGILKSALLENSRPGTVLVSHHPRSPKN